MKRLIRLQTVSAAFLVAVALSVATNDVKADPAAEAVRIASKRITDDNPDVRAQAVQDLARANNEDGAKYMMQCLAAENDGPAGWRMAEAVRTLTSAEALEEVEKHVLKWDKPENLFGAYWTFLGLAGQSTEKADSILRKAIEESKDKDIYLRSAAIEAIANFQRRDMADLLLKVLKTYDTKWDEDAPIIALTSAWKSGIASENFSGTSRPWDSKNAVQGKLGASASASAGLTGL